MRGLSSLCVIILLAGCRSMHPGTVLIPVIPVAEAVQSGSNASQEMIAYLSDGRVLQGEYSRVSPEAPAEYVFLMTPTGRVTALELAAPHLAAITATLGDEHTRMICAVFGDFESRYRCRCADDTGALWLSRPMRIGGGPIQEIFDRVNVVLEQEPHQ